MPKVAPEKKQARREEIISACEALYQTMDFKDVTIKEIAQYTSFSRPSIYNYFQTKEEIFLALYEREYDRWNQALEAILDRHEALTGQQLADALATSLEQRGQLLRLLSMNNFDMEANSRPELLVSFKAAYGKSIENVRALLRKFCPEMDDGAVRRFLYVFFPFMFGIYPYTAVTEKQKAAMRAAGTPYQERSVYDLTYGCLCRLLNVE